MSDYRVRVNIRNNRLLKAMEAKGFTSASKFERSYGLRNYSMINLVNGTIPPLTREGKIRPLVKEILEILGISIEQAFTEKQLEGFKKNSFTFEAKESQLIKIAEMKRPLEISLMEKDIKTLIDTYIYSLPETHRKVIRGIIYENRTLEDLAKELKVSRERIRQIYKRGIHKLRTSENFEKLIESGARDLFNSTMFVRFPKNKISTKDDFEIKDGLEIKDNLETKDNLEVKDDLEVKDNLETVETVESMENIKKDSFELNKGEKMTLEELSEKMMDDWRDGVYTKAYNDYDALLSGREMRDIFIEEAKKKADVVEPGEIQSYADYFEEAIEEGIANLR